MLWRRPTFNPPQPKPGRKPDVLSLPSRQRSCASGLIDSLAICKCKCWRILHTAERSSCIHEAVSDSMEAPHPARFEFWGFDRRKHCSIGSSDRDYEAFCQTPVSDRLSPSNDPCSIGLGGPLQDAVEYVTICKVRIHSCGERTGFARVCNYLHHVSAMARDKLRRHDVLLGAVSERRHPVNISPEVWRMCL